MGSELDQEAPIPQASSRTALLAVPTISAALVSYFLVFRKESRFPRWAAVFPVALLAASLAWVFVVSAIVPEPYLDEFFHIPQAQKYCEGRFREWDDKITTPPGLYLLSLLVPGVVTSTGSLGTYACSVGSLRTVNVLGLQVLSTLALLCRRELEARLHEVHSPTRLKIYTQYAIHTAFNIGLFPLLFFFSGLYYTDVLSTAVVLGAYLNHLKRLGRDRSSVLSDFTAILLGILGLFMRQTNVFWVVVYMGGLEAVHAIKTLRPERVDQPLMLTLGEQLKFFAWRYSVGDIHDPPLNMLWPDDMFFCVLSLGVAALCNPLRVLRQIWPYIATLASFVAFVAWNGGVVLGDKSNHVATIHLAQMLYIWPFFAFFSLPLLLPYALPYINIALRLLRVLTGTQPPESEAPEKYTFPVDALANKLEARRISTGATHSSAPPAAPSQQPDHHAESSKPVNTPSTKAEIRHTPAGPIHLGPIPNQTPQDPRSGMSKVLGFLTFLFASKLLWPVYLLATINLSLLIVKLNTIIHPFTLADNRHYMFYIFRYTIRRATWIRYALIIPYTLSRWMTWGTMAGCSEWLFIVHGDECSSYYHRARDAPYISHPFWVPRVGEFRQTNADVPRPIQDISPVAEVTQQRQLQKILDKDPLALSSEPTSTSTGLIFLLATTLSLITAPLVEPRYFIIPWVIWRLLVPGWRLHDHDEPTNIVKDLSRNPYLGKVVHFFKRYDLRLILETGWFIAINVVTMYIFLFKPYVWKAEDGSILDEGRLQRFMW